MDFSHLHERLRVEIVRRINRGHLTGTLLARQTGLRPSHISNFIHRKRKLSLAALDRVLAAQSLSIEDLLPESNRSHNPEEARDTSAVPLVSPAVALHSPIVNQRSIIELIHLPAGMLDHLHPRRTLSRREWQRFLAVRVTAVQARSMEPLLSAGMIAIMDRHYNSLLPYQPHKLNIYAVNANNTLLFRYVGYEANRIILRSHVLEYPVELLRLGADQSPSDCIVGRVCAAISEL